MDSNDCDYDDDDYDDDDDDVESNEDNYFPDDACTDDDEEGVSVCEMPDDDDDCYQKHNQKKENYTILTEKDMRRRQDDDITKVSTVLSISKDWASLLLRNFRWNVSQVHEEWFADGDRVREKVGLLEKKSIVFRKGDVTCTICFDRLLWDKTSSADCGHRFCNDCFRSYIESSINDGPGCLLLKCPNPNCNCAIDQDLIDKLVSDDSKSKYSRFLVRSFIEQKRTTKWCPAPGCDHAIEFTDAGDGNYDVSCLCSYSFCWNCDEESHRPVDCQTVSNWLIKNSAESENKTWILANSKKCPKCKCLIEKNFGCMHMTCPPPCKFEFCWLCMNPWSKHGYNACNGYTALKKDPTFMEEESKKEEAREALKKYMHYYERWQTNQISRNTAKADQHKAQTQHIPYWKNTLPATDMHLMFITEAWQQIIECRRVLKWTYAYGYYLSDDEPVKKEFFEHIQGLAESCLEKLHQCAESDAGKFIVDGKEVPTGFAEFRVKLCELTNAAKTHFGNLVRALENGLSDVYAGALRESEKKHIKIYNKGLKKRGGSRRRYR